MRLENFFSIRFFQIAAKIELNVILVFRTANSNKLQRVHFYIIHITRGGYKVQKGSCLKVQKGSLYMVRWFKLVGTKGLSFKSPGFS